MAEAPKQQQQQITPAEFTPADEAMAFVLLGNGFTTVKQGEMDATVQALVKEGNLQTAIDFQQLVGGNLSAFNKELEMFSIVTVQRPTPAKIIRLGKAITAAKAKLATLRAKP